MKPVWDAFSLKQVVLPIASQEDIINDYGSIQKFKQLLKEKFLGTIRETVEIMMRAHGEIRPAIMLLTKPLNTASVSFGIKFIDIGLLMETEQSKKTIPHVLRHLINRDRDMPEPGAKIYGLLFLSEAWVSQRSLPEGVKVEEVELDVMPSQDPKRIEVVMVSADFIFGSAAVIYKIVRPRNKAPYLEESNMMPPLEFNNSIGVCGLMDGLLRKTAGVLDQDEDKVRVKRYNQN